VIQTNATLTRVTGAGAGESFDGPAAAGPEKWAGEVGVYVRERRDRARALAGEARIIDRLVLVDRDDPAIDWRSGDVVTYTKDGVVQGGAVKAVQRPTVDDPDIPADLQTTRLTLEPA
jgi:hypothetical protein